MLRPLALLKGYIHLWLLCRTACGWGNCSASRQQKPAKSPSPRAVRRSTAGHRTGYEAAGGLKDIQRQPGRKSPPDRLGKRGSGVSPAPFGDFCAYKSHPGSGAGKAPPESAGVRGREGPAALPLSPRGVPAGHRPAEVRLTAPPITRGQGRRRPAGPPPCAGKGRPGGRQKKQRSSTDSAGICRRDKLK